jgi:thioredoxin reductase (NADPH)
MQVGRGPEYTARVVVHRPAFARVVGIAVEVSMNVVDRSPRRPLILVAVSSEAARARVVDELERRYADDYRVAHSPTSAALGDALRDAAARGDRVALILADDPSPVGDGDPIFAEGRRLFPDARRGLLVEWGAWARPATVTTVLDLMTRLLIDYYVVQPTHSPDEYFHRSVTEFLLEWTEAVGGGPQYLTVIGDDAQPRTHELRGLLARGGVPHRYLTPDSGDAEELLAAAGVQYSGYPVVRLADGSVLVEPTNAQLAESHGLTTKLPDGVVDVAIVGAGPGGLAAAVYAASEGLDTLVLERDAIGGQAGSSSLIRNYLGFARGISGSSLAQRAYQQAWVFGARFAHTRHVVGMSVDENGFRLAVAPDEEVRARSVVLGTGVSYRRLDVPALDPYVGAAVFYGASAVEAKAQSGRIVHVVGGGNSAGQAALHLARYASSVSLIVRSATLAESMSRYLIDQLEAAGVHIITQAKIVGGGGTGARDGGTDRLDHIVLRDRVTGEETSVRSDAVFITIGAAPHTSWLADAVLRDQWGFVLTGNDVITEGGRRAWSLDRPPAPLESAVPGFFAIGDVRRGSVKRVASAVGEGSVVVSYVHARLAELAAAVTR